jgi:hypothetical protein
MAVVLSSCFKKKVNWNVTLDADDKKPYGSYLAYESLKLYFPNIPIQQLSRGFRYDNLEADTYTKHGKSLLVLLGLDLFISDAELSALLSYAHEGHEVMIFCSRLDGKIEDKLRCRKHGGGVEEARLTEQNDGKNNINTLLLAGSGQTYGYEGRTLQGYFNTKNFEIEELDSMLNTKNILLPIESTIPDTLGYTKTNPNFLRFSIGKGHITLHAAPLVMSNYFLLQRNNRQYLEGIWATLPAGVASIYWNSYFKHSANGSNFGVLWRYPATRWALIISVGTLLLYVLFEAKRRQRIIPILEKTENTSVSFVETVGRLYFNKGDHNNIANKIVQHFLEWVRLHYFLNTNELNEQFVKQLSAKSGQQEATTRQLVELIHIIRLRSIAVDEATVFELYNLTQAFYKTKTTHGTNRRKTTTAY